MAPLGTFLKNLYFRSASCIAVSSSTCCIKIKAGVFKEILGTHFYKINSIQTELLQETQMLKTLEKNAITSLLNYSQVRQPIKGQYIYEQGKVNPYIYFIVKGQVELIQMVDPKCYLPKDPTDKFPENIFDRKLKLRPQKMELFQLLKLFKGEYIGDETSLIDPIDSQFSARAASHDLLMLEIPKEVKKLKIKFLENCSKYRKRKSTLEHH